MAQYMRTALDVVQSILINDTPALLAAMTTPRDPFTSVGRAFVGLAPAPPQCWVMPQRTTPKTEGTIVASSSEITVKAGIVGAEPEMVAEAALDYINAIDMALRDVAPQALNVAVLRICIQEHDYGPLYERGKTFARFPEAHVIVHMEEQA